VISAKDVDPKTRLQQVLDRGAEIRMQTVEFTRIMRSIVTFAVTWIEANESESARWPAP
jgi:hypothetical protein